MRFKQKNSPQRISVCGFELILVKSDMALETLFTVETSSIKYGPGATREIGFELERLGAKRVMVLTDAGLAGGSCVATVMGAWRKEGIQLRVFDR